MDAFYDDEMTHPSVRLHPYIAIHAGQSGYVDFKREPSRIPEVLEDFKPFAGERAIQTFYEFLRWINGPDSLLETCDCAFRGVNGDQEPRLFGGEDADLHSRVLHAMVA